MHTIFVINSFINFFFHENGSCYFHSADEIFTYNKNIEDQDKFRKLKNVKGFTRNLFYQLDIVSMKNIL